jgi:hypothetical protein
MGELKRQDKVEHALDKLKATWKVHKYTGSKNALFKSVMLAFKSKKEFT